MGRVHRSSNTINMCGFGSMAAVTNVVASAMAAVNVVASARNSTEKPPVEKGRNIRK